MKYDASVFGDKEIRPGPRHKAKKKDILDAIAVCDGTYNNLAELIGYTREGCWKRVNKDNDLLLAFESRRESLIDLAESVIFEDIKSGNVDTAKWLLNRLGKKRGYSPKQEIEQDTTITVEYADDWDEYGADN